MSSSQHLKVLAVAAGVCAHQGLFKHGDWHLHGPHIIVSHLALGVLLLCYVAAREPGYGAGSFGSVLCTTALTTAAYLGGLFSSMTIYRLFFHKISSFKGPKLAAITKLWHVWHIRYSTNFRFQEKIYEKYGPIVRTGPNEITIFHPAAFELLDGHGNDTSKDIWYDIIAPQKSAVFTRDKQEHKEGRKVWAQSLSTKAMNDYHPRIARLAQALAGCIETFNGAPVDLDTVMSWFSFDVMGEVLFGKDFNLLESKITHPAIKHRDRALAVAGPLGDAIWIALLGFKLVPWYGRIKDWHRMVKFCEDHMVARLQQGERDGKLDMAGFFIDEHKSAAGIKSQEERDLYLAGTAVTAVVAGSDTTRAALIGTWWYLCTYPEHAKKIQAEIEGVDVNDANALAMLPHLDGVVHEALRLVPPAMTGGNRITGPNGLMVDDVLIPPYTKVTAPKWVIHRMESSFVQPNDFIPERWYSRPELIVDKRGYAPFSYGARYCLGKSMAYVELRLTTAIILSKYDVEFAPGYDPETMWRDMKDQVTCQPGEVLCLFKPRQRT
ncbi:cytochrome P450 monooxygenase-like protein [Xylariaceae sp. FL1272]|nr:cytochrome P450 monooxygenase-like protein [Xylariaceae sp. FL1272]